MQCASSIAKNDTSIPSRYLNIFSVQSRSGATYSSFSSPRPIRFATRRCSTIDCELFTHAAEMPHSISASTWSFISEINGDTTTAKPGIVTAGAWKQIDFPPPVGSTTTESRCSTTARIASACNGRNES